jgi:hypothetical protein
MRNTLSLLAFVLGPALFGQALPQPQVRIVTGVDSKPLTVDLVGPSGFHVVERTIKGKPYSAEAVNETSQVLADGNKISRKNVSAVYRDSQGRTRNEMSMPSIGPWASGKSEKMITIFDPVAKATLVLHPDKTASRHEMPSLDEEKTVAGSAGPGRAKMVIIKKHHVDGSVVEGARQAVEDVVIERIQGVEPVRPDIATGAAVSSMKNTIRMEHLGKRMIEGVEAEGTKTIQTIPAGEIGNERDIEVVDETWFSKEIEALVYSRHSDPQIGETIYRLMNIQRTEPSLSLFELPAGYKLNPDSGSSRFEFRVKPDREE